VGFESRRGSRDGLVQNSHLVVPASLELSHPPDMLSHIKIQPPFYTRLEDLLGTPMTQMIW